jgi:hypothetical protein
MQEAVCCERCWHVERAVACVAVVCQNAVEAPRPAAFWQSVVDWDVQDEVHWRTCRHCVLAQACRGV